MGKAQVREVQRLAARQKTSNEPTTARIDYLVKKPGAYRLGTVLDEYRLEVQRKTAYTFVVPCPQVYIPPPSAVRCLGDLSDISWQVDGVPPLKISYKRSIKGKDVSLHFQSLQPDGFTSPLISSLQSTTLITSDDDVTWARSQRIVVSLNESMTTAGPWQYAVDEVVDGFGNTVRYSVVDDEHEMKPKSKQPVQSFQVKERPRVRLEGCDIRRPLKVARGEEKELPIEFYLSEPTPDITAYSLTWEFSPIDTLTESGDHGDAVVLETYSAKNAGDRPRISKPGLYTLKSVSSGFCEGEVQEPSTCLLLNPLEPELKIQTEEIPDLCAGNSIGLRVDMDFVGTPPFVVRYTATSNGRAEQRKEVVKGMRYSLELIPSTAGEHKYKFTRIDDAIYKGRDLQGTEFELEQNVKPAANALILGAGDKQAACLEENAEVHVLLQGEPPFSLEWELVHDGKGRITSKKETGIETAEFSIHTGPLVRGGDYTLSLTKVQDVRRCPVALQHELKITVQRQRPRAAFGALENKYKAITVESEKVFLPLRLAGVGPWTVSYKNLDDGSRVLSAQLESANDRLQVKDRGVYELVNVRDSQCPGVIESSASVFEVDWVPRPELSLVPTEAISEAGGKHVKTEVCQGDIDGFSVAIKGWLCLLETRGLPEGLTVIPAGSPPYVVQYRIQHKPEQGAHGAPTLSKRIDTMSGKAGIPMDTSKAGTYTYTFWSLSDESYDSDQNWKPVVVEQIVNARPSATFSKPGQSYKYCKADLGGGDMIPITLTGVPPFALEVEIKHQSGSVSEPFLVTAIDTNSYGLKIPTEHLKLGTQQIRIREIKDAKGCQSRSPAEGSSVQVQLFEAPSIYPLETRDHYCVGDRLPYTLSGTPPFEVYYTFGGTARKAKSPTTSFRRIAETPGDFRITGVSDKASECRASVDIFKTIHPLPAVRISKGRNAQVDIHEGGEVEILFEFEGTPPFDFTYTRSSNAKKGQKSRVLETRHDLSHEYSKVVRANQEGTYEVVAIKDQYCAFSTLQVEKSRGKEQKLLQ